MNGFLALGKDLGQEYALFTYLIETPIDPVTAGAHLCQEQSTAQWHRVGVEEDFREKYGAKVVSCKTLEVNSKPKIQAFVEGEKYTIAEIKIAHPTINFGPKIPNLITAAAGEGAFHCPAVNTIKLVNVELPEKYLRAFEGPKFGLKGLRRVMKVKDRPFFFGVVKPNIGLPPKPFAELAYQAWKGGLDACKDDELLSDVEYSPLKKRLELVLEKMFKAEQETGEKKMFVANITDEVDRVLELHDLVAGMGGNAVMVNAFPVGLSGVRMLAKKTKIPVVAHFDFIAPFTRMPYFGVKSELITRLQRLAGCDAIIMPGLGKRMLVAEEEVKENVKACLYDMKNIQPCLPVPGGSDWAGSLPKMHEAFQTVDFGMVPGRGVFGHPLGPEGGARSLREAWEALEKGVSLEKHAETHEALRTAIECFGKKKE